MNDQQLRLAWQIFEQASQLPPADRSAFLQDSSADPAVLAEVLLLLEKTDSSNPSAPQPSEPASSPSSKIGSQIGHYALTGFLGRGGMGEVYSARDLRLGRLVALKLVTNLSLDPEFSLRRHMQEARAASSLSHPNIVAVYELVESPHHPAIAMELVEGRTFRELTSEALPIENVCYLGAQVAEALSAAHRQGLIHRDIKPENLMVRPDGCVKVLDFGLARDLQQNASTSLGLPVGTLRYMSPEQTRAEKLTGASDVFSLGLILFELATGRHPFPAASPLEAAHSIAHDKPAKPSALDASLPRWFDALLERMLHKDPAVRPSASEVAQQLKTSRSNASSGSHANVRRPLSPVRRFVWPAVALTALSLLALAFWRWLPPSVKPGPDTPLEATPFTTEPNIYGDPAISADATRVVYLVSTSSRDLVAVVRGTQGGDALRLTSAGGPEEMPTWSPDGKFIALLANRVLHEVDLNIVRADGSQSSTLSRLRVPFRSHLAWSPDGQTIFVSTNDQPEGGMAIYSVPRSGAPRRKLTTPPPSSEPFGDISPAVSPDGRHLAFCRTLAWASSDLFVMPLTASLLPAGPPERVPTGKPYSCDPAWTPDGKEIIFSTGTLKQRHLARVSLDLLSNSRLLSGVGEFGYDPALARNAAGEVTLLYSRKIQMSTIYSAPMDKDKAGIPKIRTAEIRDLVSSRSYNEAPNLSPDEQRFALVSNRTGSPQVWVHDFQSNLETQWTDSKCADVTLPRWSPDGRRITYTAECDHQTDVFVTDGPGRSPLRLTDSPALDEHSRFSPDGKWVYFTSYRDGYQHLWRAPSFGGPAEPVTRQLSSGAVFSFDAKTLFLSGRWKDKESVWAMPADGSADPKVVLEKAQFFAPVKDGIFFLTVDPLPLPAGKYADLAFFDFATGQIHPVPGIEHRNYEFAVRNDGRAVLFSRDTISTDLMKVSNFR